MSIISPEVLYISLFALLILLIAFLLWSYYPRRGRRKEKLTVKHEPEVEMEELKIVGEEAPEDAVRAVLTQRIDGIKNRNARSIAGLVDGERYTKFDDWPPFERQDSSALDREAEALKVIKEYDYEATDWKVNVFGDAALASFIINYRGRIRDLKFSIHSRVTSFLVKRDGSWKIIHEHWSRFPEQPQKK
jgi:hypothetical protein